MRARDVDATWRTQISGYPRALDASADGRWLALGLDDGHVQLVRAGTGELDQSLKVHGDALTALSWNPRLPLLASAGEDGAVKLCDMASGTTDEVVPPGDTWAQHVAWNPKGSKLASSVGRRARIHALDGRGHQELPEVESTVAGLAWAPDGQTLGAACYGGVRLFEPKSGRRTRKLDWKGSMLNVAWSPNGKVVACGCQDNSVHFWRLATGRDSMMSGYPQKPSTIAWSHDSAMLATGGGMEITVWQFDGKGPEGSMPLVLEAHRTPVTHLCFSPLVKVLASGDRTGEILLWFPDEANTPVRRHRLPSRIEALTWALDPDAAHLRLVACDAEGHVAAWSLQA